MLLKVAFNYGKHNSWESCFNEWRQKTIKKIKGEKNGNGKHTKN